MNHLLWTIIGLVLISSSKIAGQTTANYQILKQEYISLDFSNSDKRTSDGPKKQIQNRLIALNIDGSNSSIKIGIINEELGDPICQISLHKNTLNIIYKVKGIMDSEGVEIVELAEKPVYQEVLISGITLLKKPRVILLNGLSILTSNSKYKIFPITFKLLNGDTINYVDQFGQKQGTWIEEEHAFRLKIQTKSKFKDSELISYQIRESYRNGNIRKFECWPAFSKDSIVSQWFYSSGELYKETYSRKKPNSAYQKIFFKNGRVNQAFIAGDYYTELIGYHDNGMMKYRGRKTRDTKFSTPDHSIPDTKIILINCEVWAKDGTPTGQQDIKFYKYDLSNFEDYRLLRKDL